MALQTNVVQGFPRRHPLWVARVLHVPCADPACQLMVRVMLSRCCLWEAIVAAYRSLVVKYLGRQPTDSLSLRRNTPEGGSAGLRFRAFGAWLPHTRVLSGKP